MSLNVKRINQLADYLEAETEFQDLEAGPRNARTMTQFNMSRFEFNCGAPACIAGHACTLFRNPIRRALDLTHRNGPLYLTLDTPGMATKLLGLSHSQAGTLFTPSRLPDNFNGYNSITPKVAAAVLRHLAKTGEVDWSVSC